MRTRSTLTLLASIVLTAFVVSGCGSKKKAIAKVKPEKVEIAGDLAGYLQVVDGEYQIAEDMGGNLSVKVKAIKAMTEDELKDKDIELSASMLGDGGTPVSGVGTFTTNFTGAKGKLIGLLKKGSGEEIITLQTMGYRAKEHADNVKSFTMSSTMKEDKKPTASSYSGSSSTTTTEPSSTTSSSSESDDKSSTKTEEKADAKEDKSSSSGYNISQYLDDYEDYMNQYIKLVKKAKNNDPSAMSEYMEMLKKAQDMQRKLEGMKSEMTASDLEKFTDVQTRLMKAMQEAGR